MLYYRTEYNSALYYGMSKVPTGVSHSKRKSNCDQKKA